MQKDRVIVNMSGVDIVRLLYRGMGNALAALRLIGELGGADMVRAIYIGREEVGDMCEVIVEFTGDRALIEKFLDAASSQHGFVEAIVEDFDARLRWEGLR
ncbi:MAG: hypothetical protein QXE50_00575 [Nitrososphaerota archaeon]